MKSILMTVSIVAALFCASTLSAAGNAAAGKDLYMKKCAGCHGNDGEGKDQIAQLMKIKFVPLGSKEAQSKSDAELKKIMLEGKDPMKPVKDLTGANADDIVAFLRTIAKK